MASSASAAQRVSTDNNRYYRSMAAVSAAFALVAVVGIGWGTPNGNHTWAADSVAPMTPAAVAYNVFVAHGPNSGYFYFKYPVGHQLFLAGVSLPVIAYAAARGELGGIDRDYPFGFTRPERYLTAILILIRLVSVLMAAGLVALAGGIARRVVGGDDGRRAGVITALVVAGSYPLVFYAHTSNVEVPYLFWAFAALYSMIRALEDGGSRWYWLLGAAAAMAVSTKEQIAGFLVPLPLVIALLHWLRTRTSAQREPLLPRGAVVGGVVAVATFVVVNAGFYNPAGVVNRIGFLTHTLEPEVRAAYAPYEFPIDFSTDWSVAEEGRHILKTAAAVGTSLGWPATLIGLFGLGLVLWRYRSRSLYLIAPFLGYYVVSLRVLKQVEIRYTMALSMLLAIAAGIALGQLWGSYRRARPLIVSLIIGGIFYSTEVVSLMVGDPRYQAEAWMQGPLEEGRSVEVYQSWTYLPRWQRVEGVDRIAFAEATIAGVKHRNPDYIVLSSKGIEGIYMYPNPDWRDGRGMMLEASANRTFLRELTAGHLGYREVAHFARRPLIARTLITSLNPAISVYQRTPDRTTPRQSPRPQLTPEAR